MGDSILKVVSNTYLQLLLI